MQEKGKISSLIFVNEKKPDLSYKLFSQELKGNKKGLCITREPPENVIRRHQLHNTTHYWIITRRREGAINPLHLNKMRELIDSFVRVNRDSIVFIDGIEYLITMNNYSKVIDFLEKLGKSVERKGGSCIIPIDSRTLKEEELRRIKTRFQLLDSSAPDLQNFRHSLIHYNNISLQQC